MAGAEVRWRRDDIGGTLEVAGKSALFSDEQYEAYAGHIEDVGPAPMTSLRRVLVRPAAVFPEIVVGDEPDPRFAVLYADPDDAGWDFLNPTRLIVTDQGWAVSQDFIAEHDHNPEEIARCVLPYLRQHRCSDLDVRVEPENGGPGFEKKLCTLTFRAPTRSKTVRHLYDLARGFLTYSWSLTTGG